MAKYRKIALVEAVQWDGIESSIVYKSRAGNYFWVTTKTGNQIIRLGDYIITNPYGETYICPKAEFEEIYVLVE